MSQFAGTRRSLTRRGVLGLPFALAALRAHAADGGAIGTVSRLAGAPTIRRPSGQTVSAARGMLLHEGDSVATGANGRVEITVADGSTIMVGEQTTVVLTRLVAPSASGPGEGLLDLVEGILRLQLPHSWNRFQVTTATAVAAVRSTEWLIGATPSTTSVFVAKGRVEVENRARTAAVLLDPAYGTDVPAGGIPTPPHRWAQARIDAAVARTSIP